MKKRRTRKLINSSLQLKLSLWLVGVATLAMLFQFTILATTVSKLGTQLPNDSQIFFDGIFELLLRAFLASLAISLSLTFVAAVLLTHRVAGPIYRFTQFLQAVNRGEHAGECRIRKNDELKDFCELLNVTTEPLRRQSEAKLGQADDTTSRAA